MTCGENPLAESPAVRGERSVRFGSGTKARQPELPGSCHSTKTGSPAIRETLSLWIGGPSPGPQDPDPGSSGPPCRPLDPHLPINGASGRLPSPPAMTVSPCPRRRPLNMPEAFLRFGRRKKRKTTRNVRTRPRFSLPPLPHSLIPTDNHSWIGIPPWPMFPPASAVIEVPSPTTGRAPTGTAASILAKKCAALKDSSRPGPMAR